MIRSRLASALNARLGRVWWCDSCGRYRARRDLHDYIADQGGICNSCMRSDPDLHFHMDYCYACRFQEAPDVVGRLLARAASIPPRMVVCHGCGKWGARGTFHEDGDPERAYCCDECETEVLDGPHEWNGFCPPCRRRHATEAEAQAAREKWWAERRAEAREAAAG